MARKQEMIREVPLNPQVVHFFSDGFKLEADYFRPPHARPDDRLPAIVLCPGFGAIRRHILPDYAALFAAAGYAVCALDYRGFGGSDGHGSRIMPLEQVQDIRAALTWLSLQPGVDPDRLGLWGTSGGGAHAPYVAGVDSRVKCTVGQIGYADGYRMIMDHKSAEEQARLLEAIRADRAQRAVGGEGGLLRVIDLISDPATVGYVLDVAQTDPSIITYVTLASAEAVLEYRPIDVAHRIGPRALLLIAGTRDEICPLAEYRALYDKVTGPRKWVEYAVGHYEIYAPEWVRTSAAEAVAWFDLHL